MKILYCPVCGDIVERGDRCRYCSHPAAQSEKDAEYYIEKAKETYKPGDILERGWMEHKGCLPDFVYIREGQKIAFEEEFKHNPLFNHAVYYKRLQDDKERLAAFDKSLSEKHKGSVCPNCGSNDIVPYLKSDITLVWHNSDRGADVHRLTQKCKRCGRKW